jgi:hypothetical protein
MSETTLPPPTPEQVAAIQGAQVVLDPASKASEGARGIYDNLDHNTLHRNAGYIEMGHPDAPPAPEGGTAPTNVDAPFRGAGRHTA